MTQNHNFRIEFFGGPNDGLVLYQWPTPEELITIIIGDMIQFKEAHLYKAKWLNTKQVKYIYSGVVFE